MIKTILYLILVESVYFEVQGLAFKGASVTINPKNLKIQKMKKKIDNNVLDNMEILLNDNDNDDIKSFYIETSGCQMNLADSDVVNSILNEAGFNYTPFIENADVILTNTCAIRDNAESKTLQRLRYFQSIRKKNNKNAVIGTLVIV